MNIKVTLVDLGYELNNCFSEKDLVRQYYKRVTDQELELLKNTQSLLHLYDDEQYTSPYDRNDDDNEGDDNDYNTPEWAFVHKLKSELKPHGQGQEPPYERSYVFVLHSCGG